MTAISRLAPAHRGYEYQDLLVACRFVDILLGNVREARCDEKLFDDDRFDDLTTVDLDGIRERVQFKHTDDDDRPLSLDTFTKDQRGLRLDRLFDSMLTDRDGAGRDASAAVFRVVLRDQSPTDPTLTAVLKPGAREPGPFLAGMQTERFRFRAQALREQRCTDAGEPSPFAFLFSGDTSLNYDDLKWVCDRLIVEVGAPRASLDLTEPAAAEHLLLVRARADVGAETFPNAERTAVDVAAALVSAARAARQGLLLPSAQELLRRARLRSDFGAVSRAHPVDQTIKVPRPTTVAQLADAASERADAGGCLLIVGPPGHGKSWVCQQLLDVLDENGWLVAEHYCYLGNADGERLERVLAEAVLGSLLGRLAAADQRLVHDQRPRFAADENALVGALRSSLQLSPDRRIALVVDGIDHITRVRAQMGSQFDPSRSMSETLAALDLPPGVVLVVLSQPGSHLASLRETGATTVELPGLARPEIHLLASRLSLVPSGEGTLGRATPLLEEDEAIASFIDVLAERSGGNALYATYLCRETLRSSETRIDPASVVLELPPFDGTLKNYYDHLYKSLGADAGWVADIIALVDFAVTRAELREIRPDAAHRVDGALELLAPVLIERATQGGVRIYHESFARYLRAPFQDNVVALAALFERITDWLEAKGLFADARAFHSLLPLLADAGDDKRVVDLVDPQFVTNSVAAGYAASAINTNLATAVGAAARLGEWPTIVRYVELSRAADAYQTERFDATLVTFADVPAALLGADTLAERLLDEDRTVMPARAGLQMCAAVDSLGATPPWRAYMDAYLREAENDNTSYGGASDKAVALAWLRGRLRVAAASTEPVVSLREADDDENARWNFAAPIDWSRLAEWIDDSGVPMRDVIAAVLDTHGWEGVTALVDSLPNPADVCIVVAEALAAHPEPGGKMKSPREWAAAAARHGAPAGSMRRLLALGVDPSELGLEAVTRERERLLELTRRVQTSSVRSEDSPIAAWLDACALAAYRNPLGLGAAEAVITGEGWFPCWLRFVLGLSRADVAASVDRGRLALEALQLLAGDLRPFAGDPRACDLYSLHPVIAETITHAMATLDDAQWRSGLRVLSEVSSSITTTMSGELGGPVPPDLVLRLAVDGATPARRAAAEELVAEEITRGSGHRFYSDIAEYRLLAARLALAAEDRQRAEELWHEACVFLTAYGWHKDITIYEVLDPFPVLIEADPRTARRRLAELQALCERVPLHTDLRETRHAWSRWWSLLAKADPVRGVHLAVPELHAECNDPNWLLNEALEYVWREWHEHVDPVIAGALRLTLDTPLDAADTKQLERLAGNCADPATRRLLIWLLARADERPVAYSFTNSDEMLARDDEKVSGLNMIAAEADLPPVVALRDSRIQDDESDRWRDRASKPVVTEVVPGFPPGLPGVVKAIRTWHRRPYNARAADWHAERFANAIGYRLIGLLAEGRPDDATSALTSLASGLGLEERAVILRSIAEGLERHGETQLAARAYALTWTRARGRGGWLTFGGETAIDSLLGATALDAEVASAVVAAEIERIVATSRTGTYGISQAVIYALTVGAFQSAGGPAVDIAFDAWDEAFRVIAARAPRVDDSDDPDVAYAPPDQDGGEPAPGDLEGALALAALGGLAHPGREKKRRAFLATRLLVEERPTVVGPSVALVLTTTSDAATLTWLLSLLDSFDATTNTVIQECQAALRELATRDLLTVRALARRMITSARPALAPSTPAAHASHELLTPGERDDGRKTGPPGLDEMLDSVAGQRTRRGERIFRGLRSAVRSTAASTLSSSKLKTRLERQLDTFGDRVNERWPDAFLAPNQAIEEALQSVAGGGRAALIVSGNPVADPIGWDDILASAILDDPTVPLTLEAHRQPRPPLPPPPGTGHELWAQIRERASGCTGGAVEEVLEKDGVLCATLTLEPVSSLLTVERGPYGGWCWLGTVESRAFKHPDWREKRDLIARRYRVAEVRNAGDRQSLTSPPVAEGDLRLWRAKVDPIAAHSVLDSSQPLIGIDHDTDMVGDGREGLGAPRELLVPLPSLVALLALQPGPPCSYEDDDGAGLALVTWRAEYDVSEHYLARPRTYGSGIVIRPDLLANLAATAGDDRIVVRDFIIGVAELANGAVR
jgi:hypothetical protein